MVELVTNHNNIMNDRFETLWPLGILPGLANVVGRHSRRTQDSVGEWSRLTTCSRRRLPRRLADRSRQPHGPRWKRPPPRTERGEPETGEKQPVQTERAEKVDASQPWPPRTVTGRDRLSAMRILVAADVCVKSPRPPSDHAQKLDASNLDVPGGCRDSKEVVSIGLRG
jgi:hypothetical protein